MAFLMLPRRKGRDDLTAHGFRSTFRDWAAERTSYPREVAEKVVAPAPRRQSKRANRMSPCLCTLARIYPMVIWPARLSPARMDVRKQFGRILRGLRNARKLTQEELAYRASIDVTYLSDLERGKWNPSLAVLVDLARALAVHPSELLADLKVKPGDNPAPARKRLDRR
jgi:XRE family transcriptional regulator, regulator of sulfur utilization